MVKCIQQFPAGSDLIQQWRVEAHHLRLSNQTYPHRHPPRLKVHFAVTVAIQIIHTSGTTQHVKQPVCQLPPS